MKKIKSTMTYKVPSWNFCNSDHLSLWGDLTKERCQFCIREGGRYRCALYGVTLQTDDTARGIPMIKKVEKCCDATAGFTSEIIVNNVPAPQRPLPKVDSKIIAATAIETYERTMDELMTKNNLPYKIASQLAKRTLLK